MSRGKWISIAAVLVSAIVVLLVVVAVVNRDESSVSEGTGVQEDTADSSAPEQALTPGRVTTDLVGRRVVEVGDPGGTPIEPSGEPGEFPSGTETVEPPKGLELQRVPSGTTLMVSATDGPTSTVNGVMTGYGHSSGGAALVAANYIGLGMEMGNAYADFLEQYAAGMVSEDPALIDELRARDAAVDGQALRAAEGFQAPRWFRFEQCDEEFCTVDAAMPSVSESVGEIDAIDVSPVDHPVVRVSLTWTGDQWEIVSGRSMPPVQEIDGSWITWF